MKHVLTIAGHDLSSGAGVTKDMEVFLALGLHPLSIPTGYVIQGPRGVRDAIPTPRRVFGIMLRTVQEEVRLDGIKVGALIGKAQVRAVSSFLKIYKTKPVVLDPIISSKNGFRLVSDDALEAMVQKLFPLTTVITPNVDEASAILRKPIRNSRDMETAARLLAKLGPEHVLLKGGHLPGDPVDILLIGGREILVHKKRRVDRQVHGTGCTLSSLILSFVVQGYPIREAFIRAEGIMEELLKKSYKLNDSGYWYSNLGTITCGGNKRFRGSHSPEGWLSA